MLCCSEPTINESVISDQGPGDDLHQFVDSGLLPCLNTSTQLQHKMKQKVEASLVEKIAFTGEMELLQTTDKLLYSWPQSIQQPATL